MSATSESVYLDFTHAEPWPANKPFPVEWDDPPPASKTRQPGVGERQSHRRIARPSTRARGAGRPRGRRVSRTSSRAADSGDDGPGGPEHHVAASAALAPLGLQLEQARRDRLPTLELNLLERDAYALCPSCGINALAYENRDGTWTVECPDDGPRVFRADVSSSDGDRYPLLSYDDLLQLPDPTWLVEGFMPEGLSVLWGPPSSYKTFVALDLALSIASGRAWHGRAVDARDVMYIAAEGRPGIRMRAEAWSAAHGHPSLSRFRVLPQAVNLLDRQQFERARRTMQLVSEPALTVIDPMARSMVGGDENKSQDVGRFIEAACSLADSVLVTHHAGKDGVRERGSGALEGAADMMARATGDGLWVDLTCTKPPKDAEAWSAMRLKMQAVGESLVPRLGDLAETSELRRRVYEEVCAAAPISQKAVRERIEKRGAVVTSALHALEAEGRIEQTINGYRPCPDVPDTPGHAASPATGGGVSQEGVPPVGGTPGDTPHPAPGVQTTDR